MSGSSQKRGAKVTYRGPVLSPRDAEIAELRGRGVSASEIAKRYGVTAKSVYTAEERIRQARAFAKLREDLGR